MPSPSWGLQAEVSFYYAILLTGAGVAFLYAVVATALAFKGRRRATRAGHPYAMTLDVLAKLSAVNTAILGLMVGYVLLLVNSDWPLPEVGTVILPARILMILVLVLKLTLPGTVAAVLAQDVTEERPS